MTDRSVARGASRFLSSARSQMTDRVTCVHGSRTSGLNSPDRFMSSLPPALASAHAWVRRQPWLGRFTLMNRLLLSFAFFPTGMVKLLGNRFTSISVDNPVGFFFEAMYQTGPFWHFIGFMQVAAAVLLLIPATSTLGAVMFVPIIFSIVLVTHGIGFGATAWITTFMLLSAFYLVCWDADRVWAGASHLLGRRKGPALLSGASIAEKTGWIMGGVVGMLLVMTTRGYVPPAWRMHLLMIGALCFLVVVGSWMVQAFRGSPDESIDPPIESQSASIP